MAVQPLSVKLADYLECFHRLALPESLHAHVHCIHKLKTAAVQGLLAYQAPPWQRFFSHICTCILYTCIIFWVIHVHVQYISKKRQQVLPCYPATLLFPATLLPYPSYYPTTLPFLLLYPATLPCYPPTLPCYPPTLKRWWNVLYVTLWLHRQVNVPPSYNILEVSLLKAPHPRSEEGRYACRQTHMQLHIPYKYTCIYIPVGAIYNVFTCTHRYAYNEVNSF